MNAHAQYRLGLLLVTGSAVAWSTAGFFTRLIPLDNWTLLFWRGVSASLGLLLYMLATKGNATWRQFRMLGGAGWLIAGLSGFGMVCFITSLTLTTVAHNAIIYGIVPFIAAGLSWLAIGERPSRVAIVATLTAMLGVVVMMGFGTREGSLLGDLLSLAMTLAMASIMVISRARREVPILAAACLSALLGACACWPLAAHVIPPTGQLLELVAFGLVNSALGIALFTLGARFLPAVETGLIGSIDAPLAPIWVWLAFGETPGENTILGGVLVFGAVVAHVMIGARAPRPAASVAE
jgi:drug/metabolite transporter (DMT)-like permease